MSITVSTTIDIKAPIKQAWDVLLDFAAYDKWDPPMRIEGIAQVGRKLTVRLGNSNNRGMTFRPRVLVATPEQELRWLGKLGPGRIVDGAHFFVLTRNADGSSRLTHGETYSGVLVTLMKSFMNKKEHKVGYENFNVAFKARVENR